MLLFLIRALLWVAVLAVMALVWVALLDAGPEGFPLSLERNALMLLRHFSGG
jgi:hypothetical protein